MGDHQPQDEGRGSAHDRKAGPFGEALVERVEDDEAAVGENRDRNHEAHQAHGLVHPLAADELQDPLGQFEGAPGVLQKGPDNDAQHDDDPDFSEGVPKPGIDRIDQGFQVHAREKGEKQGGPKQGQKRVYVPAHREHDDKEHAQQQKKNGGHGCRV